MAREGAKARQSLIGFGSSAVTAGMGLYGFINATREFNESKFGYGFARITDYIKGGKLDTAAWKADMDATAGAARRMAGAVGSTADVTMKARAEVEKLGFKGKEAESIWTAALGLHLSEPDALAAGQAATFVGSVYRAYEKQRVALAAQMGKDANDPGFIDAWIKGIAGKTAVAGAESALGPADLVEGMRQYAPQWAQFGMTPEFAMAMLAHGSNYGFRATELGTAFKSMASRIIKPTAGGLRALNALGIDRSKFMNTDASDPMKAINTLNSMLGGSLFNGRGGKDRRVKLIQQLMEAQKDGTTGTPEFQEKLTNQIARTLGRRTEEDLQEIQQAVANATLTAGGQINLDGLLQEIIKKKAGPAALLEIFEGRHYARGTPTFEFYDKMYALLERLQATDGSVIDSVIEGRKQTEAGTASQLAGAWKELLLAMQDTGVIKSAADAIMSIASGLRALPPDVIKIGTGLIVFGTALTTLSFAASGALAAVRLLYAGMLGLASIAGFGGGAAATAATGGRLFSMGAGVTGGAAAKIAAQRMALGMGKGGQMISGMSAAGGLAAGGAAAGGVGRGLLARAGALLVPGLGVVMLGASAGSGIYSAYKDYQATGSALSALKAFGWGAFTMGLGSTANAAEAPGGANAGQQAPSGTPGGADAGAGQVVMDVQAAMNRVRGIVAAVDLTAEGTRIMNSLANGMRAGIPAVQAAASSAAAAAAGSALRGAYSDGAR